MIRGRRVWRGAVLGLLSLLQDIFRLAFRKVARPGPRRVLFVRIDHIGDVLCSLPAMEHYAERHPTDSLFLLARPAPLSLLKRTRWAEGALVFQDHGLGRILETLRSVRRLDPDLLILLHSRPSGKAALVALAAPAARLIGWENRLMPDEPVAFSPSRYEGTKAFRMISGAGGPAFPPRPRSFDHASSSHLPEEVRNFVRQAPLIVLATTVSGLEERRMWPKVNFVELAQNLLRETGAHIILVGGPEDFHYNQSILDAVGEHDRLRNLSGKLDLSLMPSLFSQMDLLITVASGLMHLAMAMNRKALFLMGPTPVDRWVRPEYYESAISLGLECQPCEETSLPHQCRRGDFACMRGLPAQAVFMKARALLTRPEPVLKRDA